MHGSLDQKLLAHDPLEAWGKKEAVATAVRHLPVLKAVSFSMDKAELEQADDFLAMLAREPREEKVFEVR